MGGIVGIYRQKGGIKKEEIQEMMKTIKHRGPNEEGLLLKNKIGLGFRRLGSLVPEKSQKPLRNERNNVHLIIDGDIYNDQELKKNLLSRGHHFQSKRREEVLLHLYEEEERGFLKRLWGNYAFALWDEEKENLFLARDRFGTKPLYFYQNQSTLAFGSEIKAILALNEVKKQIDSTSLWHYLTLQYVPHPMTLFQNICKLPPGNLLIVKKGEIEQETYWQITFPEKYEKKERSFWVEGTKKRLTESVQARLKRPSRLGAFLSGGIDSALLVALLASFREDLKTFTVTFPQKDYSEAIKASKIAQEIGVLNYQIMVTPQEFIKKLPHLLWHMDEPIADPSAISLYFGASMARNYSQVIFSGEGADEIFGGYPIYGESRSLAPIRLLPAPILSLIRGIVKKLPQVKGCNYLYRATTPLPERYLGNAFLFSEELKGELVNDKPSCQETKELFLPYYEKNKKQDTLSRMQYIDLVSWMPGDILMKADRMTMACSLDVRTPFLDDHLFQFAVRIPPWYRIYRSESKHILREVARDLLPSSIAAHKKRGFPTPIRVWMKKELLPLTKEILSSSMVARFFSPSLLTSLLKEHLRGKEDYSRHIWSIILFALWYKEYFGKE